MIPVMELIIWSSVALAVGVGLADLLRGPRAPEPTIRYRG